MNTLTIAQLLKTYREGTMTPIDLMEDLFKKIDRSDDKIWITQIDRDEIRQRALAIGKKSPDELSLYGVPFAIKDNIDFQGYPTTAACIEFSYTAKKSAFVVERLLEAGAILIGKTNMDQFATGLVGTRSPYGIPRNPYGEEMIPGGSSSGSAVAVSTGLVAFSLGTDTAGSGRVPAAFNNLVGVKPSLGRLSTRGVVPACRTLDCVSIFANTTLDAQIVLGVASVFDEEDPYSVATGIDTRAASRYRRVVLAVPTEENLNFFGDRQAESAYRESLANIKELGRCEIVEYDFSAFFKAADLLYGGPWVAERFLACKDLLEKKPAALLEVTRGIIQGGKGISAADTYLAMYKLAALKRESEKLWKECDFAMMPTVGTHYKTTEVLHDPVRTNTNLGYYTNFMNLLNLSACAIPQHFREDGLPFGVTLFAPAHSDISILHLAKDIHGIYTNVEQNQLDEFVVSDSSDWLDLLVCGAHMDSLPLNYQLADLGAFKKALVETSPDYRMLLLPKEKNTVERPALIRSKTGEGKSLPAEIWSLPMSRVGEFLQQISPPLGLGKVSLSDGRLVCGFICESGENLEACDITELGGWRNYLANKGN